MFQLKTDLKPIISMVKKSAAGRIGLITFDSIATAVTTLKSAATANLLERNRILAEMVRTAKEKLQIAFPTLDRIVNSEQEDPEAIVDEIFHLGQESPTAVNIGRLIKSLILFGL